MSTITHAGSPSRRLKRKRGSGDECDKVQEMIETWVWDADAGSPLLDLPTELLEMIIARLGSYKRVGQVRRVCSKFNQVCITILRLGLKTTLRSLETSLFTTQLSFERNLHKLLNNPPRGYPIRYVGQRNLLRHSEVVKQLEMLTSQFRLLKASVWSYAAAGVSTFFDGELLDLYEKIRAQITYVDNTGNIYPALKITYRRCRRKTALYIARFSTRVDAYLRNPANDKTFGAELTGSTLLEVLESCVDAQCSVPMVVHELDGVENQEYARVAIKYFLPNCWFGMLSNNGQISVDDSQFREFLSIIREIIWRSNYEFYSWMSVYSRASLLRRKQTAHESQPFENVIFLRTTRRDEINKPLINIVEQLGDTTYFYGHRSRFNNPVETILVCGIFDPERNYTFRNRTVFLPRLTDDAKIEFDITMICQRDSLPKSILSRAAISRIRFSSDMKRYNLELNLRSHELTPRSYRFVMDADEPIEMEDRRSDNEFVLGEKNVAIPFSDVEEPARKRARFEC